MGFGTSPCPHPAWQPTSHPHLVCCGQCGLLREKARGLLTGGRTDTPDRPAARAA